MESSTSDKETTKRGEVNTQGKTCLAQNLRSAGLLAGIGGSEMSMTLVPEKPGMGLRSKQRNGLKVLSLSKEQGSGKEMTPRNKAHDNE